MFKIRIPKKHWGRTWRALVAAGPVSRVSEEPIYMVSKVQLELLREKNLPFELLESGNGRATVKRHG